MERDRDAVLRGAWKDTWCEQRGENKPYHKRGRRHVGSIKGSSFLSPSVRVKKGGCGGEECRQRAREKHHHLRLRLDIQGVIRKKAKPRCLGEALVKKRACMEKEKEQRQWCQMFVELRCGAKTPVKGKEDMGQTRSRSFRCRRGRYGRSQRGAKHSVGGT